MGTKARNHTSATRRNFVGVTLLFACTDGNSVEAVVKSYVVRCESFEELKAASRRLAAQEALSGQREGGRTVFVGIEDVFSVSGQAEHKAMLGRTTLWDCETKASALELVASDPILKKTRKRSWFLAKAIYFVASDVDGDAYAVAANVLLKSSQERVLESAREVAGSQLVLDRIKTCGPRTETSLEFLGLEVVVPVTGDVMRSGAFDSLGKHVSSVPAVERLLPDESDVSTYFDSNGRADE